MIKNLFIVGLGGAIGSMARFLSYQLIKSNPSFLTTLGINILGSLIIGVVFGFGLKNLNFENNWKLFLASGICGGFTTFSAFSVENIQLIQEGKWSWSLLYILCSVLLGISAAFLGFKISG